MLMCSYDSTYLINTSRHFTENHFQCKQIETDILATVNDLFQQIKGENKQKIPKKIRRNRLANGFEIVWMRYNTWIWINQLAISEEFTIVVLTKLLTHFWESESKRDSEINFNSSHFMNTLTWKFVAVAPTDHMHIRKQTGRTILRHEHIHKTRLQSATCKK